MELSYLTGIQCSRPVVVAPGGGSRDQIVNIAYSNQKAGSGQGTHEPGGAVPGYRRRFPSDNV